MTKAFFIDFGVQGRSPWWVGHGPTQNEVFARLFQKAVGSRGKAPGRGPGGEAPGGVPGQSPGEGSRGRGPRWGSGAKPRAGVKGARPQGKAVNRIFFVQKRL